ncbi:GntR family transcriptional regulator [Rhodococcus rhodnii]|uniref:GntR family transcriptional regulator n=1 Tax=Rhodococcus rhodnii TaxID=38312 RepID=UPI0014751C61|nr:GntR family transcriptional regulator [Rhodococcus rhodnii]
MTTRASSTVDLVLHEIRRSIMNGALAPGEPFVVQTLTAQLGVSHVPVREALRQLEAQGLIELKRSRSAVVTPLDLDDLQNIYRMRLCTEPTLSAQSVSLRSPAELDRLAEIVELMTLGHGSESTWDLHREFHAGLIQPAAGVWGLRVARVLWDAAERYTRITFDTVGQEPDDVEEGRRRHLALVDAARSRDPERMNAEMHSHLTGNLETVATRLRAVALDPNTTPTTPM